MSVLVGVELVGCMVSVGPVGPFFKLRMYFGLELLALALVMCGALFLLG